MSVAVVNDWWVDISDPWSQVRDPRGCAGKVPSIGRHLDGRQIWDGIDASGQFIRACGRLYLLLPAASTPPQ